MKKTIPFRKKMARAIAVAACLCVVLTCGYGATVYAKSTSYISMDVNPSIELCLNKWNRVVKVETYNEEAKTICDRLQLKNRLYTDAVEELLCDPEFSAYCKDNKNSDFVITIASDNYQKLQEGIESCKSYERNCAEIRCANQETVRNAHENNCSIGRYAAYEELQKYDSDLTIEDCNGMTMRELREEIGKHHGGIQNSQSAQGTQCPQNSQGEQCPQNSQIDSCGYGNEHGDKHQNRHGK